MTEIQWCTETWSPIKMLCTPVSAGCANCWHLRMAKRLAGRADKDVDITLRDTYGGRGAPILNQRTLEAPLHWRKPQVVAVQLMGDLFHEHVSDEQRDKVFDAMWRASKHTWILLTKRPRHVGWFLKATKKRYTGTCNIWLGVSVEDQKTADERIPILLQTPVAHRWVSIEPMLGPVDILRFLSRPISGMTYDGIRGVDSVVIGGESGSRARPLNPDWVRSVRDQCAAAGVPFMWKQDSAANKEWAATFRDVLGRSVKLPLLDGRVHADLGWA